MCGGWPCGPLFELENHSLDHSAFEAPCFGLPAVSSPAAKRREVSQARAIIERVGGGTPRSFRFPGGCASAGDVRLVAALHQQPVQWDVDSGDAFQPDAQVIVRQVLSAVRPGSIIVAHCIGPPNTPARRGWRRSQRSWRWRLARKRDYDGRCWARTSDLRLVEAALSQLS